VDWLRTQPESKKDAWLARLLGDPDFTVRAEILAAYRANRVPPTWPTVRRDRTIAELQAAAEELSHKAEQKAAARQVAAERKAAEKAARERAQRQAAMAADSAPYLQETEQLVNLRGVDSYRQIGELLADLRAALAGSKQAGLAERQAEKLHKRNPTLSRLTSELRRHGFLPK
jgi:murein L,D-transpeptidase YcbB/YkuD